MTEKQFNRTLLAFFIVTTFLSVGAILLSRAAFADDHVDVIRGVKTTPPTVTKENKVDVIRGESMPNENNSKTTIFIFNGNAYELIVKGDKVTIKKLTK